MPIVTPVVVVGIAGNQPHVLRFAAREAGLTGAHLHVVHAAGLTARTAGLGAGVEVLDSLRAAGRFVLDSAKDFMKAELDDPEAEFVLSNESAIDALGHAAVGAQMLVLGSDDVPWYDRLLRTKVAGHLALHAPCPVLVVPEAACSAAMQGDVVVAIDGSSPAEGPLRFAFEQADARNGVLHVLHAVPPATIASDAADLRANLSEVLAGWREQFPDVAVFEGWSVGDPRDVVERATAGAELVVVGRPHKAALPFPISRPVAMDVLRGAGCPIAVVPPDYTGV